ncbi:MAG: LamG-like jellyroll fold domain-containing protein [Caldilineaceae bacterium]
MRTLLNPLLLLALLLGNLVPSAVAAPIGVATSAGDFSPQRDGISAAGDTSNVKSPALAATPAPDTPHEAAATDVFAPYAYWQNSTDAYVAVPHEDALNPQDGATYEAWIFPSSVTGCRAIMSKGYTQGYWMGICNGRIRFAAGASNAYQESVTAILPNVWTHIAVVWDPAFNIRRFFINGDFDSLGIADPGPTGTRELRIGADIPSDAFAGFIAEARIWNVARGQGDIRRTMHSYVDEPMPGLVAAWPFRVDYTDVIGGRTGTPTGTLKGIYFVGTDSVHPFPLRPQTVVADELFNSLPHRRDSMAWAYVPGWDRTLLVGGNVDGAQSNRIDGVFGGTGDFLSLGTLPVTLVNAAAAYAPTNGKVYVFGGSSGGASQRTIYAVDPNTGVVSPLVAQLPEAVNGAAAVYHTGLDKIFVIGGVTDAPDRLSRISLFDPETGTLSPAGFDLPTGLARMGAAYSSATDSIFTFGGIDDTATGVAAIYEIKTDGAAAVPVSLAAADSGIAVVEDAQTQLLYLLGGGVSDRVWAFDPVLGQLWKTPGELPGLRYAAAALYSPENRHALLLGGFDGAQGQANVWRFDLERRPRHQTGPLGLRRGRRHRQRHHRQHGSHHRRREQRRNRAHRRQHRFLLARVAWRHERAPGPLHRGRSHLVPGGSQPHRLRRRRHHPQAVARHHPNRLRERLQPLRRHPGDRHRHRHTDATGVSVLVVALGIPQQRLLARQLERLSIVVRVGESGQQPDLGTGGGAFRLRASLRTAGRQDCDDQHSRTQGRGRGR